MDESRWERFGAAAGVAFAILLAVGAFLAPAPPHIDAGVGKINAYFADHRRAILTGQMLGSLAALAFIWFVGHLRHVLQRAEGGAEALSPIVYGAGLATVAVGVLSAVPMATLAFAARSAEITANAGVVRMLYDLAWITNALALIVTALFVASASLAMLRKEMVAAALGWAGLVVAAVRLVGGCAAFYTTTYEAFWVALGLIGFVAFLLWTLVVSVAMLQRPEVARATARRPVFVHP